VGRLQFYFTKIDERSPQVDVTVRCTVFSVYIVQSNIRDTSYI